MRWMADSRRGTDVIDDDESNNSSEDEAAQVKLILPQKAKMELLRCFRELQRWHPNDGDWEASANAFEQSVHALCLKHKCRKGMGRAIVTYFRRNWFCDEWRDLWTDAGLPEGASRDAFLNTNNWIEAGFRVFKVVFLGNRHNKRIDRLIAVLINDYYPYYALWPPEAARPSTDLLNVTEWGYNLWKIGKFRCEFQDDGRQVWSITRVQAADPGALDELDSSDDRDVTKQSVTVVQIEPDGRRKCACRRFASTGKYCHHLWAMSWLQSCGPMVPYQDRVHGVQPKTRTAKTPRSAKPKGKAAAKPPMKWAPSAAANDRKTNERLLGELLQDQCSLFSEEGWGNEVAPDADFRLAKVPGILQTNFSSSQAPERSAFYNATPVKRPRGKVESQREKLTHSPAKRQRMNDEGDDVEDEQANEDVRQSGDYKLPNKKARTGRDPINVPIRTSSNKAKKSLPAKRATKEASPIDEIVAVGGLVKRGTAVVCGVLVDTVLRQISFPPTTKKEPGFVKWG
ncbi:hypothetical protein QFC20_006104 [Naganishia adeliensis]|uniref:Uncharacterized protein n=1 Tax=Naganishia adeliensis TaxID=92952 RepID=A0ACC2VFN0_9TREE|nr:hypothetical protein QFC20_006104 [Naganishia adeliensis]